MCNNNFWLIIIIWFLFSGNSWGNGCGNGCGCAQDTNVGGCGCHNDCGCQNDCVRVVGNGCC